MASAFALRANARSLACAVCTDRHSRRGGRRPALERTPARHRAALTLYLLDTNIVSMLDPRRHEHAPALIEWLERNGASLFLSVMTITELDAGALRLRRDGKVGRADEIAVLVAAILTDFGDRSLADRYRDCSSRRAARRGNLSAAGRAARSDHCCNRRAARAHRADAQHERVWPPGCAGTRSIRGAAGGRVTPTSECTSCAPIPASKHCRYHPSRRQALETSSDSISRPATTC